MIKRFLPRSLLGRSLLIIVTPLLLVQIISTYVFYERHWDTVSRRLALSLAGDIAALIEVVEVDDAELRRWALDMAQRHLDLQAELLEGQILPNAPRTSAHGILDSTLARAMEERVRRPFQLTTWSYDREFLSNDREVEIRVQLAQGVLHVVAPRSRLFTSTTYIFVMWMVGTSLVLFGVALIFMRNQIKPIRRLAAAADSFGKGREITNFKIEGATEVRQASLAFNLMRDRIRRQVQQRTDMLAGVSHDLRTPLTRMKLQLAMLGDSPEIEELKSDVSEMETMVQSYLAFARGDGAEATAAVDLPALLEEVVANAVREGKSVVLETERPMTVPVRPVAFRRCVANLVSNATRYGRNVAVTAGRRGGSVEITIDDDGPGIPPDRREEVFRPFYRLDSSRNPNTGGVGLGLTIARDIIRNHGGDIVLGTSPAGGLRAQLRLPV